MRKHQKLLVVFSLGIAVVAMLLLSTGLSGLDFLPGRPFSLEGYPPFEAGQNPPLPGRDILLFIVRVVYFLALALLPVLIIWLIVSPEARKALLKQLLRLLPTTHHPVPRYQPAAAYPGHSDRDHISRFGITCGWIGCFVAYGYVRRQSFSVACPCGEPGRRSAPDGSGCGHRLVCLAAQSSSATPAGTVGSRGPKCVGCIMGRGRSQERCDTLLPGNEPGRERAARYSARPGHDAARVRALPGRKGSSR